MTAHLRRLRFVLISGFGLAYLWVAHQSAQAKADGLLPVVVGLAPLAVGALMLAWHSRSRQTMLALWLAVMVLIGVQFNWLSRHILWVYFLQGVGTDLLLAATFGRTLGARDNSLVTQMARFVHGTVSEAKIRYTYRVTVAWTLYFLLSAAISSILFLSGHFVTWSWFANVLCLPLLGLMFIVEHIARVIVLPPECRGGFRETIRSIRGARKQGHQP